MSRRNRSRRNIMGKTADTVNGFMGALAQGDFAGARKLLADDLVFQGPFEAFSRPEPYLEALKKLYPIVKGVKVQKLFVDGDDACLLYDMETSTPVGSALICEWYRVQDGKIKTMRAVFDARPFAPMFSK
jgi:limonene-1,2-epoxide hydrolase